MLFAPMHFSTSLAAGSVRSRALLRQRRGELHVKSWDYESAFDRVSPRLVGAVWRYLGIPDVITNSIVFVWEHQERWVELGPFLSDMTILVSNSLPQGDPIAMLGMATILLGPLRKIGSIAPTATCCTYADDRTAMTSSAEDMRRIQQEWDHLESVTALRTNHTKTQSFVIYPDRCADEHLAGIHMKILGLDLNLHRVRLTDREHRKFEEGCTRLRRIASLPLSTRLRRLAVTTMALPVSTWALVRTPPTKTMIDTHQQLARRAVSLKRWRGAAPELLRMLLMGHQADVRYHLCRRSLQMLRFRLRRQGQDTLSFWERAVTRAQTKGPIHAYKAHLATIGAQRQNNGEWAGPAGALRLTDRMGKQLHELRLILRSTEWSVLQNRTRRESPLAAGVPLPAVALRVAQEALRTTPDLASHMTAVLCGCSVSDALLQSHKGEEVSTTCAHCGGAHVPTLDHHYWECSANDDLRRGVRVPTAGLTRRLGWPTTELTKRAAITSWLPMVYTMARIRQRVLLARFATTHEGGARVRRRAAQRGT